MNKLLVFILVVVVAALGAYFAIQKVRPQTLPNPGGSTPTTTLQSFDYACFKHPNESESRCEPSKLTEVLEALAASPKNLKYVDPSSTISFEYPSSIAKLGNSGGTITIEPIVPAYLGVDYWFGTKILIEQCGQKCPSDLLSYVKKWNTRQGSDTHEIITVLSANTSFGGNKWVKASVATPIGATYVLYVTLNKDYLVSVKTDTENFITSEPNIATAFKRILETLIF